MKLKLDFVTNSSSASYIMSMKTDDVPGFEKFMEKMNENPDYGNEGVRIYNVFHTLQELQDETNGRPFDWAAQARGLQFYNFEKEMYLQMKEIIDDGHVVVYCAVDYNGSDEFDTSEYSKMIAECLC